MIDVANILNEILREIANPVVSGDFSGVLAMPLDALHIAADGERDRSNDRTLSALQRQDAANRAVVFSAIARVRIYAGMAPSPLCDAKLPEAIDELRIALREGAPGHTLAVYQHEYGESRADAVRHLTGYVAKVKTYRTRPRR